MLQVASGRHLLKLGKRFTCSRFYNGDFRKKKFIPRRAVLYVPGNDQRKIAKIPSLSADCVVLDCEDGVAFSKKADARSVIYETLEKNVVSFAGKDCSVRFNAIDSDFCEEDMKHILAAGTLPMTVHVPKVESTEQINWFTDKINKILSSRKLEEKLRLIMFVESANALLSLANLCQHAIRRSTESCYELDGVVFGSDDFCADVGITRTGDAEELLFARQYTVTVAKAFKLQAIDLVFIDYKDLVGLKRQSEEGAQWGFTGKQVIHPGQIEIVQSAFSPSADKVKWARELIEAFNEHQSQGKGAFTFHGSMIDRPLLRQAENILQMYK